MSPVAVGIDVGGTKIAGALVAPSGTIIQRRSMPTPRSSVGADPGAAITRSVIDHLLRDALTRDLIVSGIGLGVPEFIDPAGRIASHLVMDWPEPPSTWLEGSGDHPLITVESDVRCAAIAEAALGHARDAPSCLFVSLGTGVSHAFLIEGAPWRGSRGEAIALGELPVTGELLLADERSTVEAQASGRALEQVAHRLAVDPLAEGVADLDAARHRAGRIVAEAIASAVWLFDPALVVIGGGLGTSGGTFGRSLDERFEEVMSSRPGRPPLRRSALGQDAGVVGAALVTYE